MQTIATIGLDIAKSVFQVHGVDAAAKLIFRRQLKRRNRSLLLFRSRRERPKSPRSRNIVSQ